MTIRFQQGFLKWTIAWDSVWFFYGDRCSGWYMYISKSYVCVMWYVRFLFRHTFIESGLAILKSNSWVYNFVEVSGHNPESSQTWGFHILHYKPVSNHFCSRGGVKSVRGDCEFQGEKLLRLLSQLRPRIRPLWSSSHKLEHHAQQWVSPRPDLWICGMTNKLTRKKILALGTKIRFHKNFCGLLIRNRINKILCCRLKTALGFLPYSLQYSSFT